MSDHDYDHELDCDEVEDGSLLLLHATIADLRRQLAEVQTENERWKGNWSAAGECVQMLEKAGFGLNGQPNTLWAMTKEALAQLAEAQQARDKLQSALESTNAAAKRRGAERDRANELLRELYGLVKHLQPQILTSGHNRRITAHLEPASAGPQTVGE